MSDHRPTTMERCCDVLVIGGSAAGLAGALQLARQRRAVIVVDAGDPRNAPAAHVHGYLGRDGTPPAELVDVGRSEVRRYGGEVLDGRVVAIDRTADGALRAELTGGHSVIARRVLLATGLVDELPDIDGVARHWGGDVVHCPFCHGYEIRDRRVVQVVTHPMGLHPTTLLRHLTHQLTVVVHGSPDIDATTLDALAGAGVTVERTDVRRLVDGPDGHVAAVELVDGRRIVADAVVVGPRFRVRAEVAAGLGLVASAHPSGLGDAVETDPTGATGTPGVYAAGNVTDPSLQVLPAAADGSRVGAMIAFDLAAEDLASPGPAASEADWDAHYGGDRMWSGDPNGALVAEVADLTPGRALDVGAGEGGDAVWLAERGWAVTADDVSSAALRHVAEAARHRGLEVEVLHADANEPDAFDGRRFDLVAASYASIPRTADDRALRNLLDAVAVGGRILVVSHDLAPMRAPIETATHSRVFDPDAYVTADDVAAAVAADPDWVVEVHETRPRPAGAASAGHHVDDIVLRARRVVG